MIARHLARPRIAPGVAVLALSLGLACGCGTSTPARFYTLAPAAAHESGAPLADAKVMVGPVAVPAAVDRPEFVVQSAPNQVEVDEFNRWAAPLNDQIAQAVASDLIQLLRTPDVAAGPLANFSPTYRVTIEVQRFDSMPGQSASIDAMWAVHRSSGGATRTGRTVAQEPVTGNGYDALAAAHSRALATVSNDIAAAIRAEAGRKA